jgi:hypothetical protein
MGLGILFLETYWSDDPSDRRSMDSFMSVLEANVPELIADHRHVDSRGDIEDYITGVWKQFDRYDVLVIASHGEKGGLTDERGRRIPLSWLGDKLGGSCGDRVVYLAGCETLGTATQTERFMKATNAAALIGYDDPVDWLEAAQIDFTTLGALAANGPGATGLWRRTPEDILLSVQREHAQFADRVKWRFVPGRVSTKSRRRMPDGTVELVEHLSTVVLDKSVDVRTRLRFIKALGTVGDTGGYQALARVVSDRAADKVLRVAAVRAVREIGSPAHVRHLDARLRSLQSSDAHRSALLKARGPA